MRSAALVSLVLVTGCAFEAPEADNDGGIVMDDADPGSNPGMTDLDARDPARSDSGVGGDLGGDALPAEVGSSDASADAAGKDASGKDAAATGAFVHPGILVQRGQLELVKAKIAAGSSPWKLAFDQASASRFGALTYKATPRATVECGSYSVPDYGCSDEKDDATAAYTHALLWYFTGDEAHAKKSAEILDAWSAVLKEHTNSNAPLQSAWCASVFPRAAEILRSTWTGWPAVSQARYAKLLRDVYLPEVVHGDPGANGNWELSMVEATMAIGIFLDDKAIFDGAVTMWRKRVPAYIYLSSDGATPVPPPGTTKAGSALTTYWYSPGKFVDGVVQETCRDFGHLELGLSAMFNAAETARIQGIDLYAEQKQRLAAGLEFNTQFLDGVPIPTWLCGTGKLTDLAPGETWEVVFNALDGRLGVSLPHTKNVVNKNRPTGSNHQMVWETLTHAGVGSTGL